MLNPCDACSALLPQGRLRECELAGRSVELCLPARLIGRPERHDRAHVLPDGRLLRRHELRRTRELVKLIAHLIKERSGAFTTNRAHVL